MGQAVRDNAGKVVNGVKEKLADDVYGSVYERVKLFSRNMLKRKGRYNDKLGGLLRLYKKVVENLIENLKEECSHTSSVPHGASEQSKPVSKEVEDQLELLERLLAELSACDRNLQPISKPADDI